MRPALITAALTLTLAAPAFGANDFQYYEDGDEIVLEALHHGDPATQITWSRCEADVCTPLAGQEHVPHSWGGQARVRLDDAPVGSTFEAAVDSPGQPVERFRTPAWLGPQTVQSAPRLVGEATVGGTVEFVGGTATGGFEGTTSSGPEIRACAQPASGPCYVIAHPKFSCISLPVSEREACARQLRATLAPRWAGWHLLASESWSSGRRVWLEAAVWIEPPWGPFPLAVANARFAVSAPLGPVSAPPAPTPPTRVAVPAVVKAPAVTLRKRAFRHNGRLQLGRVTCTQVCTVKLTVNGRSRSFRMAGTRALTTPVRTGRLKVRVAVDGKRLASATLKR